MPSDTTTEFGDVLRKLGENLGEFFRHLLPGVLIVGAARASHPSWFDSVDMGDPWHLLLLAVVATAVGNAWFSLNRYGVEQLIDYIAFKSEWDGPKPGSHGTQGYVDAIAFFTEKSWTAPPRLAGLRQHIRFRASAMLLLLVVSEVSALFAIWHADDSFADYHPCVIWSIAALSFGAAIWQNVIVRRIDSRFIDLVISAQSDTPGKPSHEGG